MVSRVGVLGAGDGSTDVDSGRDVGGSWGEVDRSREGMENGRGTGPERGREKGVGLDDPEGAGNESG